jgi:hypothetical protein
MTAGPRVVVVGALPTVGVDLLRQRFVVEAGGSRPECSWLLEHAPGAVAIVADPSIPIDAELGAVVDTSALVDALRSGRLGAAGLDVYEDEPHVPGSLRELPNTVLLPHLGSATGATRDAMARLCVENVIAVIEGREPPAPVV